MGGLITVAAPLCATCRHLVRDDEPTLRCVAFPAGIPDDILYSEFDHTTVHPDQVGETVYEPEGDVRPPDYVQS